MDVATASPEIHRGDLVSFGLGLRDRGVVVAEGTPLDNGTSPPVRTFKILRLDNSLVTKKASDLTVIDRSYLNNSQVVASASNVGGQIGVVTGATTTLDLVRLDERGEVVEAVSGVSPSRLRRVRALGLGDLVVSGSWLGQVSDVSVDVEVLFDDGAVRTVTDADRAKMLYVLPEDHYDWYVPQKNSLFYPGLRVQQNADGDVAICTVIKVEMSGVVVHWIASTHCGTDRLLVEESAPSAYQNPHDLTFFCVAYNNNGWGPADRCFFTEPTHGDSAFAHDRQSEEQQHELPMTVAKSRTYVDVLWQDGTRQHDVPSESVVPFDFINDQEFLPGDHVADNASLDEIASDGTRPARRLGVVRTVCCNDQTVNVSWFKAAAGPNEAREVECNDIVSAYDLDFHPGDPPDLGDIVVRLLPSGSSDGKTSVHSRSKTKTNADLSWVGNVIDLPDGHVQVKWGDGSISTVLPHEIAVAYEDNYMIPRKEKLHEDSGTDALEEPAAANTVLPHEIEDDYIMVLPRNEVDEDSDRDAPAEPTAAVKDNDPRNPAEDGDAESCSGEAKQDGPSPAFIGRLSSFRSAGEVLSRVKGFWTTWPMSSTKENVGAEEKNATDATSDDQSLHFSHFGVLQSPLDHHYLHTAYEGGSRGKSWSETVQKEWKILESDLPETIYVRAFKDRMDLLRAVMVGATGTPYQDGLFFFDIQLPPSYPAVPPQMYYHSFGLDLNPNLYDSGKVCFSLLNTFEGEGTEVWSPAMSSLLQVLVSIQGQVLNDQPYYNNGYETQVGTPAGRRNALPYSENAYILTLRSMLHLLRRPPQEFEGFVKDHFRHRGRFVLKTCEAYLHECVDDTVLVDANATVADRKRPCSVGLKLALANVIPSLVAAFIEIGAEGCEEFQKMSFSLPLSLSTTH